MGETKRILLTGATVGPNGYASGLATSGCDSSRLSNVGQNYPAQSH